MVPLGMVLYSSITRIASGVVIRGRYCTGSLIDVLHHNGGKLLHLPNSVADLGVVCVVGFQFFAGEVGRGFVRGHGVDFAPSLDFVVAFFADGECVEGGGLAGGDRDGTPVFLWNDWNFIRHEM